MTGRCLDPAPENTSASRPGQAASALAAEFLGVRYTVATHFVDPDDLDVTEFLAAVPTFDTIGTRVGRTLRAGQGLEVDATSYRVLAS